MAYQSDFKRFQIAGARMVTKELFGVARITVSKLLIAFEKEWKNSLSKQNSRRKRKLSERNRPTHTQIVWKDHVNTAPKITAELIGHLENSVSSKTVRRELHKAGYIYIYIYIYKGGPTSY